MCCVTHPMPGTLTEAEGSLGCMEEMEVVAWPWDGGCYSCSCSDRIKVMTVAATTTITVTTTTTTTITNNNTTNNGNNNNNNN